MIDREGAHRLAEEYLQEHGWSSHVVSHVQTLSEVRESGVRTPGMLFPDVELEHGDWIAYIRREPSSGVISSSTIIIIRPDGGEIVYFGSAHDEG